MSYQPVYLPVALTEYRDAVTWYNERSKRVAEDFVKIVREKIESICENPTRYRNTFKYFYETSLKKYPYYLIYMIDKANKIIVITSVYHHKRNPQKKYYK
jgi:plasmid stabilization system protein ParE